MSACCAFRVCYEAPPRSCTDPPVQFLRACAHAQERQQDNPSAADPGARKVVATRPADVAFVAEAMEGVLAWKASAATAGATTAAAAAATGDAAAAGAGGALAAETADEYSLPECNSFLRRVLHEQLAEHCPELSVESRE